MATIEDVAKYAGLSRTTVSRVINNQPYVCDEKRERVFHAMQELGYVPNSSARRLRNQKTETIAIVLPRITNPFYSKLVEVMEKKASWWGYQVIICQTYHCAQKELHYLELLRKKQVDGLVMVAIQNEWTKVEEYIHAGPIVICNESIEEANTVIVGIDQQQAAYDATVHLIEQGCRRLAFISGEENSNLVQARYTGYMKALQEHHIPSMDDPIFHEAVDVESGQTILGKVVHMNNRIDGIFAGCDEVAAGIVYAAMKQGIRVPEDLAVVGFHNDTISRLMNPAITTIEVPIVEMAEKSIEQLIRSIEQPLRNKRESYQFAHTLLKRDSTNKRITVPM
ncbi:LacI family DNA-binding transcriptional regulator [Pontibacillus litoralis]|uniref:LacI family transcription regulator n=1 Tax=Pontibacillus litoralis JSM 072002 TaxID=1385512 RepID=A0A0A5HMD1_9BACI|nr:LacI family DNA-binding transcriptional regulator [Pontibacillus litoralis]KGX84787.1 LacI family transcription regulator [Pontibacillus litoralis JSM 072002]